MPRLSEDDIFEILAHLPPTSITQLKLLSKSVADITSNNFFHLTQAAYNNADSAIFAVSYNDFDFLPLDKGTLVPTEALEFLSKSATILTSNNGLVVYKDKNSAPVKRLSMYNPARRSYCSIDSILDVPHSSIAVKFYASDSPNFKLVHLVPVPTWEPRCHCRIYDSVTKSWYVDTTIYVGGRSIQLEHPVVCNNTNTVFWASDCGRYLRFTDPYIVALDIETVQSKIVRLPSEAVAGSSDDYNIRISNWSSDQLCLLHYKKQEQLFTVWLMRKDEVISWRKVREVSTREMGIEEKVDVGKFTLLNSDSIVFTVENCLYRYNLGDGRLEEMKRIRSWMPELIPYASTMRPCGRFESVEPKNL